jgi:hypothetical protein
MIQGLSKKGSPFLLNDFTACLNQLNRLFLYMALCVIQKDQSYIWLGKTLTITEVVYSYKWTVLCQMLTSIPGRRGFHRLFL